MTAAVSIQGLGKRYRIAHQREPYGRLSETLSELVKAPFDRFRGRSHPPREWFWALRDVSFDVAHGDVVGIVGRNGAGKTTLLKVLAGITEPTTGQGTLRGRVSSLLEVGTGFHPELTGRENIFLSGSILGMRRRETNRRFDEIVAFAEVERFLDTPVKRYSSGMNVRLGFAVAAHLETEILIVDEVLAVGDVAFQKKCLAKLENASHQGRTILFVSHNMPAVENLCSSGVLLDRGQVVAIGSATEVVSRYLTTAAELGSANVAERPDRQGNGRLRIVGIQASIRTGTDSEIRLEYSGEPNLRNVAISVGLFSSRGEGALFLGTEITGDDLGVIPASGTILCSIDRAGLLPGRYSMNAYCTVNGILADWVIDAASVDVADGDYFGTGKLPAPGYGTVAVQHRWSIDGR